MSTNALAKSLITAVTLAAAFAAGQAQASGPKDSSFAGDRYGYEFRTNTNTRSAFTDGARTGKFDPYTDGARIVAGLDRIGVSAAPARSVDQFTDGARAGKFDPYTDGARIVAGLDRTGVSASPARNADPYTDGARTGKFDVFTEGANV